MIVQQSFAIRQLIGVHLQQLYFGDWIMSDRIEVARNVATRLLATEAAIDAAIASAAELVGYLPIARHEVQVSAAVGQPALAQAIATLTILAEARQRIVETHQSLAESGRQARIPERNFGGFVDKPCHHAQAGLKIVAEENAA
jgi:hypothetical protein